MKLAKKLAAGSAALMAMASTAAMTASAWDDPVGVTDGNDVDAGTMMGQIIGILLTITRYAGVALCVYGVYEIVMSFMQNQPEQKTKGVIMTLSGAAMIGMKTLLGPHGLNVIH